MFSREENHRWTTGKLGWHLHCC